MNRHLSRRERRALASGGLLILGILALGRGVPAWRAWQRDALTAAAEISQEVERAEASANALAATLDSLEARRRRLVSLRPLFVDSRSPATAGATLASILSSAARSANVSISAVEVATDTAGRAGVVRVRARADLVGDIQGIVFALSVLERGPMLLAIRELSISTADPGAADDQPEELRTRLVVEGLGLIRSAVEDR